MAEKKCFAESHEIESATTTCDINGAIRAISRCGRSVKKAREAASKLCPAGGLVVRANEDSTFQVKGGDYHSVTVAATRAGKTRRAIVPMLMSLILADKSNFVINDPKGELYEETHTLLEALGFDVIKLDFKHPQMSVGRYNPLEIAWELWNQGEEDRAVDQLLDFADIINDEMASTTNDAFWPNASKDFFVGLALLLLEAGASREEFNLASISRAEAVGSEDRFTLLKNYYKKDFKDSRSYEFISGAVFAPNDTAASIKSVFRSSISRFVGRGDLSDMLGETSCPARSFVDGRVALFIQTPYESSALSPLIVAIVNQLLTSMITLAGGLPGHRLSRSLEVVLDEFGNLRMPVPDFDLLLAAACGHGIHLHLVMQSFSQFDLVYGPALRKVALDNIEEWVYLGSRSLDTNRYFSEMVGMTRRPPLYQLEPILDVATLQRLERRTDESEAVMLIGSLKPFVAALPDLSLFERVEKGKTVRKAAPESARKTFDLEEYCQRKLRERRRKEKEALAKELGIESWSDAPRPFDGTSE